MISHHNILDISVDKSLIFLHDCSEKNFISKATYSIDLTSPQDHFAIYKNLMNSLFHFFSNPSAILFITDTLALWIWSLNQKSLSSRQDLYISITRSFDFCQTNMSSNFSIFITNKLYGKKLFCTLYFLFSTDLFVLCTFIFVLYILYFLLVLSLYFSLCILYWFI